MDEGLIRLFKPQKELNKVGSLIGEKIYFFDMIDSTNDLAFRLAKGGISQGIVIVAKGQRKGKGRWGRRWFSPYGKGIYFSIILRPSISPDKLQTITLMGAVATANAITKYTSLKTNIRWPNDILIDSKKVAGILTEAQIPNRKETEFVILGIGINVKMQKNELPTHATSLLEEGKIIEPEVLLRFCLKELDRYYLLYSKGDFSTILFEYQSLCSMLGKYIKVKTKKAQLYGIAQLIDKKGNLILRLDSGLQESIKAGEVIRVR